MPAVVISRWRIPALDFAQEPQLHVIEQTDVGELTVKANLQIAGEVVAIECVVTFDPPLRVPSSE